MALVVASALAVVVPTGAMASAPTLSPSVHSSVASTAPNVGSAPSTPGSAPSAAPATAGHHAPPGEITSGMGWEGIDYAETCANCTPPDPQLGVGAGYVLELTNGTERVWLVNGSQVHNGSLGGLFGAGTDVLSGPQVQFDLASLRWFIAVDDLTTGKLLLGVSRSSDPTAGWHLASIVPGAGSTPRDPLLAVDSDTVVVTADDFASNGSFQGAQLWVVNKTAFADGESPTPTAVDAPDPATEALVPAAPMSDSSTIYLVDDELGENDTLHLFTLNGSRPGAVTLSGPTNFTSPTAPPPNAEQPNTTDLLGVGDGRVDSAAWRAGALWAVATGACTPTGDSAARSCLHLWEVDTATGVLKQDFTWSTGPGTYDFDPALSIATRGDLALVFGESSATMDPSFLATGQAVTDPADTLEAPVELHNGTGPSDPAVGCSGGVCPFGSDFAIAATPSTNVHFWAVGEFVPQNSTRIFWRTWVNQVAAWAAVPVTFTESGLPAGASWSVTVNGQETASTNASLTLDEQNGSYTFTVLSPLAGAPGVRYLAGATSGTFIVSAAAVEVRLTFISQYLLTATAEPQAGGSVYPGGNWFDAGSSVSLSALATAGYQFETWSGTGPGSYSGADNPAEMTPTGPITEQAQFWVSATYPVSFFESGLPSGTNWTVTVNGIENGSSNPTISFNEPNGTYTFEVQETLPGGPQTQYLAGAASGSFDLAGAPTNLKVAYTPAYELTASPAVPGTGVVNPSGGWFTSGSSVNLSALAVAGELFVGWTGSGAGSYTGSANPAPVLIESPVVEQARFAPATTYPITYSETGLPSGVAWSVTTNGLRASSTASSVVFNEPNGTYTFGAQTSYVNANGTSYLASPGFGSFSVSGNPIHEAIEFAPTPVSSSAPGAQSGAPGVTGIPFWVFGAALAALLLVVGILAAAARRPPDSPPFSPPVAPPPPPAWDEGA